MGKKRNAKKKGDLTINMIFVILITIISIVLLLGVFSTKLPTFAKSIYCKTFFYIHSSAFIPKNMRADQDYCRFMAGPVDTEIVTSADDINLTLAAQIVACWKEMEYGEFNKDFLCKELTMGVRINETVFVSEEGITRLLIENDMCEILPNSDVDCSPTVPAFCGDETDPEDNKIDWRLGDMIFPEQNVLVEYNADDRVIIIS